LHPFGLFFFGVLTTMHGQTHVIGYVIVMTHFSE